MSARDDYPTLHAWERGGSDQAEKALNEIDLLRGDVSKLLAKLATTGAEWP